MSGSPRRQPGASPTCRPEKSMAPRTCLVLLLALLPGCREKQKIVLTGASTIAPLAIEIGKRFEALHHGVRVDVQTGGSSRGVNDVRQGLNDIGMVSRPLKDDEK